MRLVGSHTIGAGLVLMAIAQVFGSSRYASAAGLVGLGHLQDAVTILSARFAQHLRHGLRRPITGVSIEPFLALL